MQHVIIRSVATLAACILVPLAFPACDVEEPGDELARDLADEADDEEDASAAGQRPAGADELANAPDPAAAANYYVPVGTHDAAGCDTIAGWVKDGDTTAPTWATIHRDAPWPYGAEVAVVQANLYRGDLPFADKNHGFSIATPASLKNGSPVTLYVHGINVDVNGNWDVNANSPLINQTGRTFCCGNGCYANGGGGPTTGEVDNNDVP